MSLFDNITWYLSTSPAPVPAPVQAARDTLSAQVTANPVAFQHPAAAAAGELELTQVCIQTIETDEGDEHEAYPDPGTGGDPWTIGYGHTGPEVHQGLVWTEQQCQDQLKVDLQTFKDAVEKAVGSAPTNAGQLSAMSSLSFNVGSGNFDHSSVLRFHLEGQYQQAADAFLLWDKAAGRVMAGLVRRRHQEREEYLGLTVDA